MTSLRSLSFMLGYGAEKVSLHVAYLHSLKKKAKRMMSDHERSSFRREKEDAESASREAAIPIENIPTAQIPLALLQFFSPCDKDIVLVENLILAVPIKSKKSTVFARSLNAQSEESQLIARA